MISLAGALIWSKEAEKHRCARKFCCERSAERARGDLAREVLDLLRNGSYVPMLEEWLELQEKESKRRREYLEVISAPLW